MWDEKIVSQALAGAVKKIMNQTANAAEAFKEFGEPAERAAEAFKEFGESAESAAEAYEEFRELAESAIPEPDGNERIKQIERVRRHRARKGRKRI